MAIRCIGFEPAYRVANFVADTPDDVNNPDLPNIDREGAGKFKNMTTIGMGSDIIVLDPPQLYMLNSEGIWKNLSEDE